MPEPNTTDNINLVTLCGQIGAEPTFSHENHDTRIFTFPLIVRRTSGSADTLNIMVKEFSLTGLSLTKGTQVKVSGSLRTVNQFYPDDPHRRRLLVHVMARAVEVTTEPDCNSLRLCGQLCNKPILRSTPQGRNICDFLLAVSVPFHPSYIPCIAWGSVAHMISNLPVGSTLDVLCRFQSREYTKQTEDGGSEIRVAYECSVSKVQMVIPKLI